MSKQKTILQEQTIRRFWKLADIGSINETAYQFGSEAPLEEQEEELEEQDLQEMVPARDDEEGAELDALEDPAPEAEVPGAEEAEALPEDPAPEGEVEAEVSIPESDVEALRTARDVIDQILGASDGAPEEELDAAPVEEPAPELGVPGEEEEEELVAEVDDNKLQEVINNITDRVSKRLVKEALLKRIKK